MRGWRNYFGFCETPEVLIALTRWVRLRLRAAVWHQWKTPRRRRAALIGTAGLWGTAQYGRQRPWSLASRPEQSPLSRALQCPLRIARSPLLDRSALAQLLEPPYTDPYVRWCGRGGAERLPPIPIFDPYATCAANHSITSSHGEQHQWYGEAEHMSSLAQVLISLPCWSQEPAR